MLPMSATDRTLCDKIADLTDSVTDGMYGEEFDQLLTALAEHVTDESKRYRLREDVASLVYVWAARAATTAAELAIFAKTRQAAGRHGAGSEPEPPTAA